MVSVFLNKLLFLVASTHDLGKDDRINSCCDYLHSVLLHSSSLSLKYGERSTLFRNGRSHNASCPHSVHSQWLLIINIHRPLLHDTHLDPAMLYLDVYFLRLGIQLAR